MLFSVSLCLRGNFLSRQRKRREPQRHEDTKTQSFFLGLSELRSAGKKSLPLCLRVFVVQGFLPFATLSFEVVAKDPEKKGTTKTRRHKVFSVLVWATLGRQKKSSFVPLCLCGSRPFTFCDTHLREDDGWLVFSTMPSHLGTALKCGNYLKTTPKRPLPTWSS